MLSRAAVEVAADVVASFGEFQRHAERPVVEERRELVIHGDAGPGLPGCSRAGLGELQEPVLPGLLKRPPDRVEPVHDTRQRLALFLLEPGRAMPARADARPERHVEEDAVDVSEKSPRDALQKHWRYLVDWDVLGITPEEIGRSVHYDEAQFRRICEAGFDGLH